MTVEEIKKLVLVRLIAISRDETMTFKNVAGRPLNDPIEADFYQIAVEQMRSDGFLRATDGFDVEDPYFLDAELTYAGRQLALQLATA